MSHMFARASTFNQPISAWNTSNVESMSKMFYSATAFNQSLVQWNTESLEYTDYMFKGASRFDSPPCQPGHFPAFNGLGCQPCPAGQFALEGADRCKFCTLGNVPTSDRSSCKPCPPSMYAPLNADNCVACGFPRIVHEEDCIWWHLPLVAVGAACLLVSGLLFAVHKRARRSAKIEDVKRDLYRDLWNEDVDAVKDYRQKLAELGVGFASIESHFAEVRAAQSRVAGVGMNYLLSADFAQLARGRTGKSDPQFMDMKTGFWLVRDPIGQDVHCPRDGRPGCAMVDWIPQKDRHEQTHFLSWTWQYRLGQVTSALQSYSHGVEAEKVFFFMCFFTNNQFRIIVEGAANGSCDLERVFESNLVRIGRMVALLDSWHHPVYLSRVWTVYEQFVASKLGIPVTFIMPDEAVNSLKDTVETGKAGIMDISRSLREVDAEHARAWKREDEEKVKSTIRQTVGFEQVNKHVTEVMLDWIGEVVQQHIRKIMDEQYVFRV